MTLIEILNASKGIDAFLSKRFVNFSVVRELVALKKKVKEEVEFYISEEKKIIEAYATRDEKGNPIILEGGRIQLKSAEDKEAFDKEILSLRNVEVDIKPVVINLSDFKSNEEFPTANEIIEVEGFISIAE